MYAVPVPSAIRVNILRLRFTSEAQPRSKKGKPAQTTTGVASRSCRRPIARADRRCCTGFLGIRSDMPRMRTGIARATLTQKRRVMEASSGFSSSAVEAVRGSRAIPQMGHEPGPVRTISGCIGHVYVFSLGELDCGVAIFASTGDAAGAFKYFAGSALNLVAHPTEQK